MRILVLHAPYFHARWRDAGHAVVTWGPHPECDVQATGVLTALDGILTSLPWTPDVILLGDDSAPLLVTGLERAPCPTVLLSIDAHHHAHWHAPLAAACDVALVAQRDSVPAFAAAGAPHATWLPPWAPEGIAGPAPVPVHPVAFVGSLDPLYHPERVAFMRAMAARVPLHLGRGAWQEVFAASRIVLNQTVAGDLNLRVFEAMAAGAMLLTEASANGLDALFTAGVHLVTYPRGDADAAAALVRRYLADEPARARIAAAGQARVRERHLERHRADAVLAAAAHPAAPAAPVRLGAMARAYVELARRMRERADVHPPARPLAGALAAGYLEAAGTLARDPLLDQPERDAVEGLAALQRGELPRAIAALERATAHGVRVEAHVALIEALVSAGTLPRALGAAERLCALHPGYVPADPVRRALASLVAGATPSAARDRR